MSQQRKPLVDHIFTADPSAHVFDGKIYIYPSHDLPHDGKSSDDGDEYMMEDYHVLSMESPDSPCIDHGEILHMKDVKWVSKQMWAPDIAYSNGKYHFIFPARDKDGIFRIGAAHGKSPVGPFTPDNDYIQGTCSIDPCVFVDDDGKVYLYYGGIWGGQLEKWQSGSFAPEGKAPEAGEPALTPYCAVLNSDCNALESTPVNVKIVDKDGNDIKAGDEDRRYFEAPWMHKYNGKYYLSYSTGTTHYLVYATSDSPFGPFTYGGRIMEPVLGWTTHHSIIEYEGKWYIFYHDSELSEGKNHLRCVKFTELEYAPDGSIVTIEPYKK
ncbi:MAG: glycoside hydrolase family 43 protein [Ruminococcus sp.]|nr:glycoside hydrolase family 43 protein [Ruminococcus sp.]